MRRAVNLYATARGCQSRKLSGEKRAQNLRQTAVETQVTIKSGRGFYFVTVGTRASGKFQTAVIGNINLLVRAVDKEKARRD